MDEARERYENPEMDAETVPGTAADLTALTLVVASLLVVISVPVWRALGAESLLGVPSATLLAGWDEARAADGLVEANREILEAINSFETKLDETSPLLRATLSDVQWFQLRFGGTGNETVYAGARAEDDAEAGGWLLLRTGYDHLVGEPFLDPAALERRRRATDTWRPEASPDPRPALFRLHRQLHERGIDLVLLPVPTKPAIESASLAPGAPRPLANPSFETFRTQMEDAGIHVFDTPTVLVELTKSGTPAYLRTDSHWSTAAVSAVAESLAQWLEEMYGDELGPADAFWETTPTERQGRGDLWRLLKLPKHRPLYPEESVTANEVASWDGELWKPDPNATVLVLGDSFVNVYSEESLHWGRAAGFAEQLSFHMERHLDVIARNDGSSDQVRQELARSPERLDGKRVVVYQFATRELSVGDWPVIGRPGSELAQSRRERHQQ